MDDGTGRYCFASCIVFLRLCISGTCTATMDRTILYSLCILIPYAIIAASYICIIMHVSRTRQQVRQTFVLSNNREETNNTASVYELYKHENDLKEKLEAQTSVVELEKHKKNKDIIERNKEKNMSIVIGIIQLPDLYYSWCWHYSTRS